MKYLLLGLLKTGYIGRIAIANPGNFAIPCNLVVDEQVIHIGHYLSGGINDLDMQRRTDHSDWR